MKQYSELSEAGVEELCEEIMDRDKVIMDLWRALVRPNCQVTADEAYEKHVGFVRSMIYFYGEGY